MTIFRFDRIPDILRAIAFVVVGWTVVTGVAREVRVGRNYAMYERPGVGRDYPAKMHGHLVYLNHDDARGEASTLPLLFCGIFLGFVAGRMKRA